MQKILLMGNPNVGKSVVFSCLTGINVISSNYPGTTVEFSKGYTQLKGLAAEIIDVPGTYSLSPTCRAEEIAIEMLREGDIIINVVDSSNLERNLTLTLGLIKRKLRMVVILNFWDETKHLGIHINHKELQNILGVPVIPTCAVTGQGIKGLVDSLPDAAISSYDYEDKEIWHEVGNIVERVQKLTHRHHTLLERLADACIIPYTGIPIAVLIMYFSFLVIRFIGEGLIGYVFEPVFNKLWLPLMTVLSGVLGSEGFLHNILIGRLIKGQIDFGQSFGILTTGLFVPIAAVLPYVFAFYLMLNILEDSGFLPRLGVLVDKIMHQVGLHGLSIVPMLLGFGCNVPGALATRIMDTRRERFISATLMAICVPCMAQIAMIIGLLGKFGPAGLVPVFGTLFIVWGVIGLILNRIIPGESPEIFVEIPPYRIPYFGAFSKKLWMRIKGFIREAVPFVLLGVFVVNILYTLGVVGFLGRVFGPVIISVLGLPVEAVTALLVGFLRKDVAVGMLVPLDLSIKQLIIASVVLTMYFPCVATFAVLVRELGTKDMIKSSIIMITSAFLVGGVLNLVL